MDYKKIIAATAVTSAAIVVPVVAQAEGTAPEEIEKDTNLISDATTYTYGNTIKAVKEISYQSVNTEGISETVTETIKTYEWYIGETKVSTSSSDFIVPIEAIDQIVKVVVTTDKGTKRYDEVTISSLEKASIKFKDDANEITTAFINSTITATGFKVPNSSNNEDKIGEVITGYQWYIFDKSNNKYELLSGETDVELDVPFKAQGKELVLIIATNKGNYYGESIDVAEVVVDKDQVGVSFTFNGQEYSDLSNIEFVPGDTISIRNISINGGNNVILNSSQYSVKYQWYAVDNDQSVFLLNNATSSSFTVPADSEKKNFKLFRVAITISVPQLTEPFVVLEEVGSNLIFTESLEGYIANLVDPLTKNYVKYDETIEIEDKDIVTSDIDEEDIEISDFDQFKSYVGFLNRKYGNLTTNRKQLIKNYSILKEATQDVQVLNKFNEELIIFYKAKLNYDSNNSEVKHADLTKKFTALKKSYDKLSARQRSLLDFIQIKDVDAVEYIETMQEWLTKIDSSTNDEDYITFKKISEINQNILNLFDGNNNGNDYLIAQNYKFETLKTFQDEIKKLTEEASKVDKKYQPLIYTSALKTAQSNVKKAQAIIEKINKIEAATDTKKKASAYLAAQKAFDKLTSLQQSLVTNIESLKLEADTDNNDNVSTDIEDLKTSIDELNDYSVDTEDLTLAIEKIATEYKLLSSENKKRVTNYSVVNQVKKDVKAAEKVLKAFKDAGNLEDAANSIDSENVKAVVSKLKSAKSKYQSAYKAYIKLSTKVRTLVDSSMNETNLIESFDMIIKGLDDEIDNLNEKDATNNEATSLIDEITTFEKNITDGALNTTNALTTLNDLKEKYKKLSSTDKKKVYNYSALSTINSNISKAKTTEGKLNASLGTGNVSKLQSALKSYEKLTDIQKGLVDHYIVDAVEDALAEIQGEKPVTEELETIFAKLTGEYSYEDVKLAQKEASSLSSKELKVIANYNDYQNALKEVKAVEAFIAKIDKIGENPTYSKKQTIITSYNKLTQNQVRIFNSISIATDIEDYPQMISTWVSELTEVSEALNTFIGSILVSGMYVVNTSVYKEIPEVDGEGLGFIDSFEKLLNNIDAEYKKLDSKEKKLVPHYSIVIQAKKDTKAVKTVVDLAVQFNKTKDSGKDTNVIYQKWQTSYNKLSSQQQSLFKLAMPDFE